MSGRFWAAREPLHCTACFRSPTAPWPFREITALGRGSPSKRHLEGTQATGWGLGSVAPALSCALWCHSV